MAESATSERMRAYYRAYNSADPAELGDFYADDVELTGGGQTTSGKPAVLAQIAGLLAAFEDRMTPVRILAAADGGSAMVEIEDRLTARFDIPDFLGRAVKAGETVTLSLCGVYDLVDGRIRRARIFAA